jgi:serine/threonine protein kinase
MTGEKAHFESADWQRDFIQEMKQLIRGYRAIVEVIGFSLKLSERDDRPAMVMKFMPNGSLYELLESERAGTAPANWTPTKKSMCIFRIVAAMKYLHDGIGLIHRNLKPRNIMVDAEFLPYIDDFRTAIFEPENGYLKRDNTNYGALLFMAPELFSDDYDKYTNKIDVYAFGVSLFSFFTELKVGQELDDKVVHWTGKGQFTIRVGKGARFKRVEGISDFYWALIQQCWHQDPEQRPSFTELIDILQSHRREYAFPGSDLAALEAFEKIAIPDNQID